MENQEILAKVDHTVLSQTSTWEEVKKVCEEGILAQVASVCVPPCYVKEAVEFVKNSCKICTVVGFPNGNSTTNAKVFETKEAIENGADEIDMVINIGKLKAKEYEFVLEEIKSIKEACRDKILKVIIETCLLTEEEKIKMCEIVTQSGADYIKTSTGFSTSGATKEDIMLFSKYVGTSVKIKAAGGISTKEDAINLITAGAVRLGSSKLVKLLWKEKTEK